MRFRHRPILLPFLAIAMLGHAVVSACQVPVFRYALERWRPQAYEVVVFHRGALSKSQVATLTAIGESSPRANLAVFEVDLDHPVVEEMQNLWKAQTADQMPWIVVQVPGGDGQMHPFWSGPLASADFKQLVDSPLRRTIGRHLLGAESAVRMLVEGGNKQRDDDAFQLLQTRLKKLEHIIEIPVPDPTMIATDLPLKLTFPILRVSRNDVKENLFLRLLFFGEKAPAEPGDPVVIPIFGRGRALVCLRGSDINTQQIDQTALFLGGQCSCEVKEQCPGYDLLMAVDWDSVFREHPATVRIATTRPVEPTPPSQYVAAASVPAKLVVASPTQSAKVAASPRRTILIAATAAAAVFVIVFGWLAFRPASRSRE